LVFQNRGMRYSCCGCVCVCVCWGRLISILSFHIWTDRSVTVTFSSFFRFDFSVLRVVSSSFNSNVYFKETFFFVFSFLLENRKCFGLQEKNSAPNFYFLNLNLVFLIINPSRGELTAMVCYLMIEFRYTTHRRTNRLVNVSLLSLSLSFVIALYSLAETKFPDRNNSQSFRFRALSAATLVQ
jgi:hypothetical protein